MCSIRENELDWKWKRKRKEEEEGNEEKEDETRDGTCQQARVTYAKLEAFSKRWKQEFVRQVQRRPQVFTEKLWQRLCHEYNAPQLLCIKRSCLSQKEEKKQQKKNENKDKNENDKKADEEAEEEEEEENWILMLQGPPGTGTWWKEEEVNSEAF